MSVTIKLAEPIVSASRSAADLDGKRHITADAQPSTALPGHTEPAAHDAGAGVDLSPSHRTPDARSRRAGGQLAVRQRAVETHLSDANGSSLPPARIAPTPIEPAPGVDLAVRQGVADDQKRNANGSSLDGRQPRGDDHEPPAPVEAADAKVHRESQIRSGSAAILLQVTAAALDDIERARIAMQNRLRAMRDDHGLGDSPEYDRMEAMLTALEAAEHTAELELKRALRRHPLGAWVKATVGVGEKQGARLLACVDDPAWNFAEDRPRRGPAEFRQYCGHGDPERSRRRKGQCVEFSPEAKMRVHLIAESCMKQRCKACAAASKARADADNQVNSAWTPSHDCACATTHPYRAVYDAARASWADRDTTDGHKHNHALRLVGKAVLKDLFLAARHRGDDAHAPVAGGEE